MAERRTHVAAAVRDVARQLVRAQEHPDLDHASTATRRSRASRRASRRRSRRPYVPQAIDDREEGHARPMFIWFVLQDSTGSLWQSGIYRKTGARSPAQPKFAAAAKPLSPVNGKLSIKGGTKNPVRHGVPALVLRRTTRSARRSGSTSTHDARRQARRRSRSPRARSRSTARSQPRHRPDGAQGQDLHGDDRREHEER